MKFKLTDIQYNKIANELPLGSKIEQVDKIKTFQKRSRKRQVKVYVTYLLNDELYGTEINHIPRNYRKFK